MTLNVRLAICHGFQAAVKLCTHLCYRFKRCSHAFMQRGYVSLQGSNIIAAVMDRLDSQSPPNRKETGVALCHLSRNVAVRTRRIEVRHMRWHAKRQPHQPRNSRFVPGVVVRLLLSKVDLEKQVLRAQVTLKTVIQAAPQLRLLARPRETPAQQRTCQMLCDL